jgi:hypothetical protein
MTIKGSALADQMRAIRQASCPESLWLYQLMELEQSIAAERHATVIQVYVFDWIDKLARML